mgnify:CR=1 FL=1
MSGDHFRDAIFQLADLWTDGLEPETYVSLPGPTIKFGKKSHAECAAFYAAGTAATLVHLHGLLDSRMPLRQVVRAGAGRWEAPVRLSAVTLPLAQAAGAAGVGVGSAINRLSDELAMVAVVRGLRDALSALNPVQV